MTHMVKRDWNINNLVSLYWWLMVKMLHEKNSNLLENRSSKKPRLTNCIILAFFVVPMYRTPQTKPNGHYIVLFWGAPCPTAIEVSVCYLETYMICPILLCDRCPLTPPVGSPHCFPISFLCLWWPFQIGRSGANVYPLKYQNRYFLGRVGMLCCCGVFYSCSHPFSVRNAK